MPARRIFAPGDGMVAGASPAWNLWRPATVYQVTVLSDRPDERRPIVKHKLVSAALALLLSASWLAGCGAQPTLPPEPSSPSLPSAQAPRQTAPQVAPSDLASLAEGNTTFAFDLYQVLRQADGNLFYSPYSISLALAMTYAGARGETARQMAEALSLILAPDALHPALNALDQALASRGEGAAGKDDQGFRLNIANALWGQEGYPFLPEFLDLLAENYGAGLGLLDFAGAAEEARLTINRWVEEQTEGRIQDLLAPGVLTAATRLVLTNAIYFNAAWLHPFEAELTEDGPFSLLGGGQVTVPMMRLPGAVSLGYAAGDGYQAVELPYDGGQLSMVLLLPDPGAYPAFEQALDAERATAILEALSRQQVALTMPKFEFESQFSLGEALQALGMTDAFSEAADFSGMTGQRGLFIGAVIHKAFVAVDEAGTEAAAATAVVMLESAMPLEPVEVRVDRPFVFFIRDIETGTVLFVGRVLDPSA
jgi:serpin B